MRSGKRQCFARVTEVERCYYAQSYWHHRVAEHESTKIYRRLLGLCVKLLCGCYEEGKSLAGALQAGACHSADAREVSAFDLNPFGSALLTYEEPAAAFVPVRSQYNCRLHNLASCAREPFATEVSW